MALAVALFALVVIGALVAGAFFTGMLEQRIGRNTLYATEAAQAAEAGTAAILADWDTYNLNNLDVNEQTPLTTKSWGQASLHSSYTWTATRLNKELFLVQSLGKRSSAGGTVLSQRTVATLARLTFVKATAKAAVTVTKPITFNGNAFQITGYDSIPKG
jgi:Tfp pilus assembly protein PilX